MKSNLVYRLFLIALFAALLPLAAMAGKGSAHLRSYDTEFTLDSVPKKPAAKPEKKPSDKPEIKEVPKARRQIKPAAVGDRIKINPPVRVKPNIKKPVGNIKRGLGKLG